MNPRILELALRKQRLQLQSATQRDALVAAAAGLAPIFAVADGVRDGTRWLLDHPEWVAGGLVAVLVARPCVVFRWVRRSFFAWQLWRKVAAWQPGLFGRVSG
ncbi:MAG: YqjK-like family protein [Gammaproteobacteria bacterium]|nr:YqjK-like family protein [Gammaproteobacteria bacterium]MBU1644712.1 YqjK-like family protein [Gammaproteobacteria bacterium]MBU1973526.1 YqjK-like family protein [Gammaproteobacteria bacterium]